MKGRFVSGGIRSRLVVVVACVAVVLVSGCSAKAPTSSWTPTTKTLPPVSPLPSSTPVSVPTWTAAPSSPELYQQALGVYQQYFQLDIAVRSMGGTDEMPPPLAALLTGSAYNKVLALYQFQKAHRRWDGTPNFKVAATAPLSQGLPDGTVVAVQACETEEGAAVFDENGNEISDDGQFITWRGYAFQFNDQQALVIFEAWGGRVATCPIS